MLIVLSPAKSLDYESPLATKKFSEPEMLDHSAELAELQAKVQGLEEENQGLLRDLEEINEDMLAQEEEYQERISELESQLGGS